MDWIVGLLTLIGMEGVARRWAHGWTILLIGQAFWLMLIWQQALYGLLPVNVLLTWRYTAALLRWRRASDEAK